MDGREQTRDEEEKPYAPGELKLGDRVWLKYLRDHGTVMSLSDDGARVKVKMGSLQIQVRLEELGRPRGAETSSVRRSPAVHLATEKRQASREINLVGRRVEQALSDLDNYINAATLAGHAEVRVVHGYGTGALCKAVHEYLDSVGMTYRPGEDGRDPGGSGVTIVTL